jgi:hypothetical protein
MVEAKTLLPLALVSLALYVVDNARQVKRLRRNDDPEDRAKFFPLKATRQCIAILLLQGVCLLLSHQLQQAWNPGPEARGMATQIALRTGGPRKT